MDNVFLALKDKCITTHQGLAIPSAPIIKYGLGVDAPVPWDITQSTENATNAPKTQFMISLIRFVGPDAESTKFW